MELYRIKDSNDKYFDKIVELYKLSFPEVERREISQLKKLFTLKENMLMNAILENDGEFLGLIVAWEFPKILYLEHLAILPTLRNGGIGRRVLERIKNITDKPQVLEAEPADDGMAGRRIEFYKRNGFEVIEKDYIQPSYRKGGETTPLWVMATASFSDAETKEIVKTIKEEVYSNNYNI